MRIKFVATKKMPEWHGAYGIWRDGRTEDLPDHAAERLLGLYESPFVKVGEKSISPSSDKMIHKAEETKEVNMDELKKPTGDNIGKEFKPKGWSKRKKKR